MKESHFFPHVLKVEGGRGKVKVHLKSVMLLNRKQYTRDDTIRGIENRAFFEPHFAGNRSGKVELNRVIGFFFCRFIHAQQVPLGKA